MQSCNPQNSSAEPMSLPDRIERIGRALTADELASMLTVSRITIFKQAKVGRIPSFRIGTCVRFSPHRYLLLSVRLTCVHENPYTVVRDIGNRYTKTVH